MASPRANDCPGWRFVSWTECARRVSMRPVNSARECRTDGRRLAADGLTPFSPRPGISSIGSVTDTRPRRVASPGAFGQHDDARRSRVRRHIRAAALVRQVAAESFRAEQPGKGTRCRGRCFSEKRMTLSKHGVGLLSVVMMIMASSSPPPPDRASSNAMRAAAPVGADPLADGTSLSPG